MIRRMFWLIVGAALGVAGYRRVSRLARTVTPGGRRGAAEAGGGTQGSWMGGWARRAALFARDVRDGMELYSDRHPGLTGRTLEVQQARARRPDGARPGEDDRHHERVHPRVDYAKEVR
jgi:hypothetical protein